LDSWGTSFEGSLDFVSELCWKKILSANWNAIISSDSYKRLSPGLQLYIDDAIREKVFHYYSLEIFSLIFGIEIMLIY
jgi:hypothetical protein